MESIESDSEVKSINVSKFTDEEVKILKTVASKALNRPIKPEPSVNSQNFNTPKEQSIEPSHSDKMNFAMSNRHLANKVLS